MNQKHRGKAARRARQRRQRRLTAAIVVVALVLLGLAAYAIHWYVNLSRIRADGERYRQMYSPAEPTPAPKAADAPTQAPTVEATSVPTQAPTAEPTPEPTASPSPLPTEAPTIAPMPTAPDIMLTAGPTVQPTAALTDAPAGFSDILPVFPPTGAPTEAPTESPVPFTDALPILPATEAPTIAPSAEPLAQLPVAVDEPIPTPNEGTLVIALPTPPPVQESFAELLAHNPETVGFLQIDDVLALPVVQRENDNDYYLDHTFDGAQATEGTLFLDGTNRLVPEDDCLIVYGHNMKNNTMFGSLSAFGDAAYLKRHTSVRFDTIYENRTYVPFAAFAASTEPDSRSYFDVRQFIFDEVEFEKFVLKLQGRSAWRAPVDVAWGDRLLLLVTCDYRNQEGRFILALRQVRPDEIEANLWTQLMQATQR